MPGNDADGGFATCVRVPARGLCPVPEELPQGLTLAMLSVVADAREALAAELTRFLRERERGGGHRERRRHPAVIDTVVLREHGHVPALRRVAESIAEQRLRRLPLAQPQP